jgi:hypothetical protein
MVWTPGPHDEFNHDASDTTPATQDVPEVDPANAILVLTYSSCKRRQYINGKFVALISSVKVTGTAIDGQKSICDTRTMWTQTYAHHRLQLET